MTTSNIAGNNSDCFSHLNNEFVKGYTLRIVSAWSRVDLVDMKDPNAAYELRGLVSEDIGEKLAVEGENELSSYECYIALWQSLGDHWPLEVLRSLHSEELSQQIWEDALVKHEQEALKVV